MAAKRPGTKPAPKSKAKAKSAVKAKGAKRPGATGKTKTTSGGKS